MTGTPGATGTVRRASADSSLRMLVATNVGALGLALYGHWSAVELMTVYWAQSVIIGVANFFRIRGLDRFSTEGFRSGGKALDPTPETKMQTANFFAVHYGVFHAVYLVFLVKQGRGVTLFDGWFVVCTLAFALNHFWSWRVNAERDRQGTPNIGHLMFLPYLRVIPMHLTIVLGGLFIGSTGGLLLFGVLKIAADAAMHVAEHAMLRTAGAAR